MLGRAKRPAEPKISQIRARVRLAKDGSPYQHALTQWQWARGGLSALAVLCTYRFQRARVTLRNATNMTAAQFDLSFNPTKVAPGAPSLGSALSNHVMRSREIAPGVHRLLVYSLANASITATNRGRSVAAIPFQVSPMERVSSGPLALSKTIVARNDATAFVPLTLVAGEISIVPVRLNPNGSTDFFLPSQPGSNYIIQATTDFVDWVNISTNLATGNFLDLMDADAGSYPLRFYRWMREP